MPMLVETVARHIAAIDGLDPAVMAQVQAHLKDTLGCALCALALDTSIALGRYASSHNPAGSGHDRCTAIGLEAPVTMELAALVNGTLFRSQEFDDMAMPDTHPSGVVVAVALAAAEHAGASGARFLHALALGLELLIRLDRAGIDPERQSSGFLVRGQDATAICGTVAGAAAAAFLLTPDPARIATAMGIALSFASGSLEANRTGGTVKRIQSGWAARSAVMAALLALDGAVTGPAGALDGRYGFYNNFVDGRYDGALLVSPPIGDPAPDGWLLMQQARYKPYPSNYYTHSGITAACASVGRFAIDEIESIRARMPQAMLNTVGAPSYPADTYAARFNAKYTVAAAYVGGHGLGLWLNDFSDEALARPEVQTLAARVQPLHEPAYDALFPDQAPTALDFVLHDGRVVTVEERVNWGGPQWPLPPALIDLKFRLNAGLGLPASLIEPLHTVLQALPGAADVRDVTGVLRQARAQPMAANHAPRADPAALAASRPRPPAGADAPA